MASNFPGQILTYTPFTDLLPSDAAKADRWHMLKMKENKTAQELEEFNTLTDQLATKLFSAEKFNSLYDEIIALEQFFTDSVQGYIAIKQTEFQAEIDKFTDKGTYANTTNYVKKNIIQFNGEGFICQTPCKGISPISGQSTVYWALIAKQGEQGVSGTGLSWRGTYSASITYYKDDCVCSGTALWFAKSTSVGQPLQEGAYWGIAMQLDYPAHAATHASDGADPITAASIGAISSSEKGQANGLASLDGSGKIPASQVPEAASIGVVPATEKGAANGVATLDASGKIPTSQLPAMSSIVVQATAPTNTSMFWIDSNTRLLHYHNGTSWVAITAVYGA